MVNFLFISFYVSQIATRLELLPENMRVNSLEKPKDLTSSEPGLTRDSMASHTLSEEMTPAVAVRLLKAIAQETRLSIIEVLLQEKTRSLPAGVIAASLDISPNLMSFHLKELSSAAVLEKKTIGRNNIYSVNTEVMESFFLYLAKYRAHGDVSSSEFQSIV